MSDPIASTPAAAHRAHPGEHLCFRLSGESFAVPIAQVQEVLALPAQTAVPDSPPHIRGVFPLRGIIVPLVDLAGRLRLAASAPGREACAVVVRAPRATGELVIAMQVDEILDVAEFAETALSPAPDLGAAVPSSWLLGMHRGADGALTAVLDLERILAPGEIEGAAAAAGA